MNKMLLHICCAPCSTSVIERLRGEYDITLFFYNPNVEPLEEYQERLEETRRFAAEIGVEMIEAEYDNVAWCEAVKGYEDEPEKGKRCPICFDIRLKKTAEYAAQNGFDLFTTTLSVSSHKDHLVINQIGQEAGEELGVKFYQANFKKGEGFKRSLDLSKVHCLRRQNYCGCIFSKR
ncbi:MAG: epoxyqueuosine reductase QueH [Nitrospinota bacterium]|nr:epoxyqueuosine reductase QueH [Nitrospinota bacterium]